VDRTPTNAVSIRKTAALTNCSCKHYKKLQEHKIKYQPKDSITQKKFPAIKPIPQRQQTSQQLNKADIENIMFLILQIECQINGKKLDIKKFFPNKSAQIQKSPLNSQLKIRPTHRNHKPRPKAKKTKPAKRRFPKKYISRKPKKE
jgi:hypothetical protein